MVIISSLVAALCMVPTWLLLVCILYIVTNRLLLVTTVVVVAVAALNVSQIVYDWLPFGCCHFVHSH